MSTCENCEAETRNDAYVCDECCDKVARCLGEMPWLEEQIEVTITKQRASVATEGGRSTCSCKDDDDNKCQHALMPYHVDASRKRAALRSAMVTAIRFCTEEGVRNQSPSETAPADTLTEMSRWLLWRVDGMALNDMGAQMMADVVNAARACKRVIDKPPERRYAGPCQECKKDLYHRPGAVEVTCSTCGNRWDVGELHAWMTSQVMGRLVTAREGATLLSRFDLETQQGTIDKWRERGLIVDHGHDTKGRRMYLFDDLVALAARHVRKGA